MMVQPLIRSLEEHGAAVRAFERRGKFWRVELGYAPTLLFSSVQGVALTPEGAFYTAARKLAARKGMEPNFFIKDIVCRAALRERLEAESRTMETQP